MAEEEKSPNSGCSEIKELDDDSESNKAGPSKAGEEKAPNAGCSEIKEVDDDSESNKAGPSKAPDDVPESLRRMIDNYRKLRGRSDLHSEQEKELKFDRKSMSDRDYEVKYLRFEVAKLRSQVDVLKFKIDDLKSGHRSRSRYLWHKITQLSSRISQLTRAIRFQLRIMDCALKSTDEIFADQMMLFKEVDLLLAEVNLLVYQAIDLSKTTICYEQTPTFRNVVSELNRLRITTTVEPRSLFRRSLDLADKINLLLRTQVLALESLVANPKSPYRTHAGGWISGYFRQRGGSSPTLGRIREAESSSSDTSLERLRGKEILKSCGFSFLWKKN